MASVGVIAPGWLPMPQRLAARMTALSVPGETMKWPPTRCAAATCAGSVTVPTPMLAASPWRRTAPPSAAKDPGGGQGDFYSPDAGGHEDVDGGGQPGAAGATAEDRDHRDLFEGPQHAVGTVTVDGGSDGRHRLITVYWSTTSSLSSRPRPGPFGTISSPPTNSGGVTRMRSRRALGRRLYS